LKYIIYFFKAVFVSGSPNTIIIVTNILINVVLMWCVYVQTLQIF